MGIPTTFIEQRIKDVDLVREEYVLPHLHRPDHPDDMACLHRAAITCDVDDATAEACERRLGAGGYGGSGIYGAGWVQRRELQNSLDDFRWSFRLRSIALIWALRLIRTARL